MLLPIIAFVGLIVFSSLVLFLSSRGLKLKDQSIQTALLTSLIQWGLAFLLGFTVFSGLIVSLLMFFFLIKFFYKIDMKTSFVLWVVNLGSLLLVKLALGISSPHIVG